MEETVKIVNWKKEKLFKKIIKKKNQNGNFKREKKDCAWMVEILSEDYKHSGLSARANHYGWRRNYSGQEYDVSAGGIVFLCGADYLPDSFARVAQTADAPRVERERREREREIERER